MMDNELREMLDSIKDMLFALVWEVAFIGGLLVVYFWGNQ